MEEYITTDSIYNGILLGAKNISMYKDELNRANKFPVPDNDTGDNLHYLMTKIRQNLKYNADMNKILSSTSDLAILNSRGNSGAIFSQFFVGFEQCVPSKNKLHIVDFIKCFERGYESAYNSISNPVLEGTVLIAIKNWSDSLKKHIHVASTLESLYFTCLQELRTTVENSRLILKAQRKGNERDAGAMAFLYFIEGFMSAVVGKKVADEVLSDEDMAFINEEAEHDIDDVETSEYRFCTEVLIKKNDDKFHKGNLENIGDCLVISGNDRYMRIHIHTNNPSDVTRHCSRFGEIIETKCDDMLIQSLSINKGGTALLIDSIADIPEHMYSEHTYMLPVNILIDNVTFEDKRTVFAEALNASSISSSQPSTQKMKYVIAQLLKGYDNLIILTVSSMMSGIHSQYQKIVDEYGSDRIKLIDTKLNSVAEGLIVYRAIELINDNLGFYEISKDLEETIKKTKIYVRLRNLDKMISSGRLSSKAGKFLKWLNFLPIISIDEKGEGKVHQFSFSSRKNKDRLKQTILKHAGNIKCYSIVHCNNMEGAKELAENLKKELGEDPLYIGNISSVIQIFSGDGSVAVGFTLKD